MINSAEKIDSNVISNDKQVNKKVKKKIDKEKLVWSIIFIAPLSIFFLIFRYYTSLESIICSFFDYRVDNHFYKFVGFDNYVSILTATFWTQLKDTIVLYVLGLVFGFWVPILQALLISNLTKRIKGVYRYLILIPAAVPSVASFALWKFMWAPSSGGLMNTIVGAFGIGVQDWLYDPNLAKICLRIPGLLGGGVNVLIYLVAIDNVPQEMYEAARLDGASDFKQLFLITLPNIRNIIGVQFLLSITGSLLCFDDVYVLTQGQNGTETVVMGIYNQVYKYGYYGQGMATSVILLILTAVLSVVTLKIQNKLEA